MYPGEGARQKPWKAADGTKRACTGGRARGWPSKGCNMAAGRRAEGPQARADGPAGERHPKSRGLEQSAVGATTKRVKDAKTRTAPGEGHFSKPRNAADGARGLDCEDLGR